MRKKSCVIRAASRGFSLIEMMIVLLILSVIMGAIFQMMRLAMARSSAEQAKLDMFQEAREFMDQMARDLRQAGYPNPRNFASTVLTTSPVANDSRAAVGIVKIDAGDLWFEGDVDGSGTVSVVQYHLDTSAANNCPCLRRSQLPKVTGNPYTGQTAPAYQVEVQNIQNTDVFSAYVHASTGTAVTLPVNFNSNGSTIASIEVIKAVLTIQSTAVDAQTGQRALTTLISTVKLNNCSQAATGQAMSCQ